MFSVIAQTMMPRQAGVFCEASIRRPRHRRHEARDFFGRYDLGAGDGGGLAVAERAAKAACYQFIRDA
jgi:hypothetical protein